MKLTIHLASAALGLTLLATTMPAAAALAKGAPGTETGPKSPAGGAVVAQDGSKGPKVEGWQTGAGDMSDEDCQGLADQIGTAINDAIADAEANDIEGMLASLDFADSAEDLANTMGCAINIQAKSAPGRPSPDSKVPGAPGTSFKVEGWSTGEGDMTEADCETLANNISQELDWASQDLESGDLDQMFYDLSRAEEMEDQALDGGCALSYPK